MSMLLMVASVSLAIWVYLLCAHGGFWLVKDSHTEKRTSKHVQDDGHAAWPDIAVVIPARNEADILDHTLPTLLAGDYPGTLHITLVDDRSEDGTAMAAARIGAHLNASDRLHIVTAPPLPAGWKGKVWAMQCGLEHITGGPVLPRYILFTDADIAYDKDALSQLVAKAESDNLALASLMVKLRCESVAERYFIPAFVYFFRLLYPFSRVNQPARKLAAAAGGCMLARTDALRQAGGLKPMRGALIDDCALGRLMKEQGRIWLSLTQEAHSIRPYPQVSDIRRMVARSAYDQLHYSMINLAGATLGLLLTFAAPVMLAVYAGGAARLLGAAAWLCMAFSFAPMLRFYNRSPLQGLLLPVIALCYLGFTFDSAWQYWRGKGGAWKGRNQATGLQRA